MARGWALTLALALLALPAAPAWAPDLSSEALLEPLTAAPIDCPNGMTSVGAYWGSFCIDRYEASRGATGLAVSVAGASPWTNLTWEQARAACGSAGKRLCRDREWLAACDLEGEKYRLLDEEEGEEHGCRTLCPSCGRAGGALPTGSRPRCRSAAGAFDMVGNVWEWTDGTVQANTWGGEPRTVGELLGQDPDRYGDDAVFPSPKGTGRNYRFLRGGSWSSGPYQAPRVAGCFSLSYESPDADERRGFRCCSGPDLSPQPASSLAEALLDRDRAFRDSLSEGIALCRAGLYQEALEAFEAARALSPANLEAWNGEAVALASLGRLGEALDAADAVLARDPGYRQALFNRGLFLAAGGRYEEAVRAFGYFLKAYPGDANATLQLERARSMVPPEAPSPSAPPPTPSPGAEPSPHIVHRWPVQPSPSPCPLAVCGGECVDLEADPDHCGACGATCRLPRADAVCSGGECLVLRCERGWGDCDLRRENGCEASLDSDPERCGSCVRRCREEEACVDGRCTVLVAEPAAPRSCDDANPCTADGGAPPECEHKHAGCGTSCGEGRVCDGEGVCVAQGGAGDGCSCPSMCAPGIECDAGACTAVRASCGDGRCEGECSSCPRDCLPEQCRGNRVCDRPMGEGCEGAPQDCPCAPGYLCSPGDGRALENGCVEVACGDGRCDPAEGPAWCCLDCPCPRGSACEDATRSCVPLCGNRRCDMGECIDCPRDCTCLDCRCSVEVGAQGELGLRAGQLREAAFTVRNTGLLEDTFEVSVSSELDMEWMDRSVELGPGEDEAFAAVLRPSRAGTFPVTVRVASRGARRALERTLVARVTEPALGERALSAISPILRLKDLAELVIVAASLLFAAWRYSSYRRQLGEVSRGAQALQGGYPYPAPPYGGYEGSPWSGRGNV